MNCVHSTCAPLGRVATTLGLCGALLLPASAQNAQGGQPGMNPGFEALLRQQQQQALDQNREPLDPVWQPMPAPRPFAGFPVVFPRGLGGFGAYPSANGAGQANAPGLSGLPAGTGLQDLLALAGRAGMAAPLAPEEPADWPRWLRDAAAAPLPYVPDKALLVRHAERVWWKSPDEDAFVPLYFYDKVRSVGVKTAIEVRQNGEFEVLFHGGGRLVSQGQTQLQFQYMDEKRVALQVAAFSKLRIQVSGREYAFELPDGSVLSVPADVPPASPEDIPDGPALVVLDRAVEPGRYSGRAALWNGGMRTVHWQHAFGKVEIAPGQRVEFFLSKPAQSFAGGLVTNNVQLAADGAALRCTGLGEGHVVWSGAKFALPKGSTLRLDPLLGAPFVADAILGAPATTAAPRTGQ